ncbi:NgoFVII family restriction endonuclease [Candidatus Poribacteria bacterium]|nr:NgoFVII family restriction endonuclease [Candidatus Poribacteria bacterium]MYF56320.1 NgoFVII family restriction endonuclease [Candidatus Poribacteria bacterium]
MSNNSNIRDNNIYGTVADFLRNKIQEGSSLSFVSAYFTINAFYELRDELRNIKELRFLFGEPSFIQGMDPTKTESKVFRLTEEGLELKNYLPQNAIAKACYDWIEDKVEIKSVAKSNFLHGKMYYIEKNGSEDAILGSSNFTVRGLGLSKKASNIELNLEVDSKSDCADLKTWFDNLWESDQVQDVKEEVKRYLENIYTDKDPEFIYFKTLYHVFEDFLENASDADFAQENPKFQHSEIWKKLYEFQKHGVQACIKKLKAYNGCIIADSVGLGKTFEALAIIKYFEIRGANVLVLCPKKLEQNWTLYSLNYRRKNNPLKKDNFRYNVRAHSDLTDRGKSDFDWENFDLVVIDESHNFRNRPTDKYEKERLIRRSRYNKLLEEIIKDGCKTQVLMLSATPVNNKLTDLENQIRLITEDNDNAFQNTGINSVRETLRNAQNRFEKWTEQNGDLSNQPQRQDSLAESLNADFFNLLDRLTIARSREHIIKFYHDTDDAKIKFPDREKPIPVYPDIDTDGIFPSFQNISTQIDGYKLALFNPSFYIKPDCLHHYDDRVLKHRESNLIGMMKVNFLKRLESSVHSFDSTLQRTIEKINKLAIDIQDFLQDEAESDDDYTAFAEAEAEYGDDEDLLNVFEDADNDIYQYEHLDLQKWLEDLQNDRKQLIGIQRAAANITPERDAKLEQLKQLINNKVQNTAKNAKEKLNPKVLVFTAFADTANYLYDNLYGWAKETLQLESAVVTGSANKTTYGNTDFNEILTNFSPISKERTTDDSVEETPEINLLIGTDCISEGQNLQDCDYLINYDIHWNPVRIIQRFGRIDRIGSKNKTIRMVNFWPTPELDEYINLKVRVEARMALVNLAATGYDNPLTPENRDENLERVWSHRDEQLRRMQTNNIDFDDLDEQLNISQFTLDDFRAQLLNYLQTREDELRQADLGLYAVTQPINQNGNPVDIKPGVIFCLKQVIAEEDNKEGEKLNPIHPYYLVYVTDDEVVSIGFTNPKRILERFSALCVGKTAPDTELCDKFNEETNNGSDMTIYQILSEVALKSIRAEYIRQVNDQLDSSPDALLPTADSQITEETKFELVTWLVIRH